MPYWAITSKEAERLRKVSGKFFVEAKAKAKELRDKQARELVELGRHLAREFRADVIDPTNYEDSLLPDLEDVEEMLKGLVDLDGVWADFWDGLPEEIDDHAQSVDDALERVAEDIRADEEDES
jgi:hypothetical protein